MAYLPAADPSQVVDARDPASVHRFKQDLHGLGISVGVRHVATPDSPHIEIVVPPARDAAALAEHIVSRLPSHAAAACRLRRALAGAGIASRVSVARPRPPKERCEECRIRTGDSPAWCTSCLPREVSPGHLHPKDAVLLLGGLQAPDWLTDIDLDDMADLHRIADALQTVLRQITEEDVTVVPHPQCGVCEARAIEIEGTLSGGGADRLTAAILKRPTHDASKKSRSAAPRLINLLPTAVDSAGPDVEMPLSTRDLERRAAAAAELLRPLRTVESVLAACHMSNRRDTAAITLLVDRLLLSGFVVDRSSPDSVDRLKTVLAHEGIDAKATIRTVQGSPHAVEVALRTVADAVALRHFIVQNLPLDCAAAWRLTVALNLLGIDARASVNAIGALSIMRLSPQEALRLHEVALRRVDPTARALDLDEFRDVVLLAAMLMNTLSDLLDRQIAVSALADEGETAYYPDIEIETSFEIFEGDRLAAALTRAHDSFPDDVEGTYS
ncbi:hypothetical protein AOB60_00755 [Streptomyces noursei]|uniref:Uncharacterized protein n=1 Tax=Streptomyces noursei TaxID=1971 RepID=A0A2N8PR82_STRNR|nr:hypothetical protein AOB60_00755 [Streptomyces noursei]